MKKQNQNRIGSLLRTAALAFVMLVKAGVPQASALVAGAAPQLVGLTISTPAGDSVELSSANESLRGIAIEADIAADSAGVDYFELRFTAPDGRILTYLGSKDALTKRNYLVALDKTRQTYLLNEREIRWWFGPNSAALEQEGTWALTSALVVAQNGQQASYTATNFPAGVAQSFRVTRCFSRQPVHTYVLPGATLSLSPAVDSSKLSAPGYQWYRDGVAIAGATSLNYTKAKAAATDNGLYYLQVTSAGVKVRSDPVVVSTRSADVTAARAAMNLQNGTIAKTKAAAALNAVPTGSEELFVSALAELVAVIGDKSTATAMTSLGVGGALKFPSAGLTWSGTFAANTSSSTVNTWLSAVFLPALDKADAAFAKIGDTKFLTTLTSSDFGAWGHAAGFVDALMVDYGDVQMLRAIVNGLSAVVRLWGSLDTAVRLDLLQVMQPQGKLTVQSLLTQYPTLLAAAGGGAASQTQAVASLAKAAAAYLNYSNFALSPGGISGSRRYIDTDQNLFPGRRQFSQDPIVDPDGDAFLRDYAVNITASIANGVRDFIAESSVEAGVTSRYPVNLKALNTRTAGVRSATAAQNFVPIFTKNRATGTIGNPTLNGVLPNLTAPRLLARIVAAEPQVTEVLGSRDDQSAPLLILTDVPVSGNKIRLLPDAGPVRLSGTVQDESEIGAVIFVRTFGSVKETFVAELEELQAVIVAGKLLRTWRWSLDLDFEESGLCAFEIYATDTYNQKSVPKTGGFTVAKAVRVLVDQADLTQGTLVVTPAIPADGFVDMGTKLRVSAVAKPGYVFRLLEVVVNGAPEDDISRPIMDVVIAGETVITPQFIVNPFPALAGQWNAAMQLGYNYGIVNLTVTKTGNYSIRVTSGRNTFSYNGVFDASGLAKIPIPVNFTPYGSNRSSNGNYTGTTQYAYLSINSGIQFSWSENGGGDMYSSFTLAKAGEAGLVAKLPSRRYTTGLQGSGGTGYSAVDVSLSGAVLYSGVVNVPKQGDAVPVTFFRLSHGPSPHGYQSIYSKNTFHLTAGHTYRVTAVLSGDYQYVPGDCVAKGPSTPADFTYDVKTVGDHKEVTGTATASADFDTGVGLAFYRNGANLVVEVGNIVLTDTTSGEVLTPAIYSKDLLDQWQWSSAETPTYRTATVHKGVPKTVRFSASSFLVPRSTSNATGEQIRRAGFNYYAVASPSDICVYGSVDLDSRARGSLDTLMVLTGALDPNSQLAGQFGSFNPYQNSYEVSGYPYVAAKQGQTPLPFVNPSKMSFNVAAGDYPMGLLSLTNLRPVFRYSAGTNPVVQKAAMSVIPATGALSGSLSTQIGGATKASSFSGVLLQGGSMAGIGLATDGTVISFQ